MADDGVMEEVLTGGALLGLSCRPSINPIQSVLLRTIWFQDTVMSLVKFDEVLCVYKSLGFLATARDLSE